MQISCERCGTTYALDERLIPAGGAPVQCTRCGHVFTAMPPGAAAPRVDADVKSEANKTMIFGKGANASPGPSTSAPAAPPPPPASPRSATQVFGGGFSAPPVPEREPFTQMFGTAAPPAAGGARAPSGLPGVQVPSPAVAPSGPKVTQMFGSSGAGSSVHGDRAGTQIFGAGALQPPGGAASPGAPQATQVFGGGPGQGLAVPPAERSSAQMFGGVPAQAPAVPGSDRQPTQVVFGGPPAPGAAAPAAERSPAQMFGGVPAQAPAVPGTDRQPTQVFGSAPTASAPTAPARGKSGPNPAQSLGVAGLPPTAPIAAPAKGKSGSKATEPMFEAVSPDAPTPVPSISTTQMFGAPPGFLADDGPRARPSGEKRSPPAAAPPGGASLPKIAASVPAPLADEGFADTVIRDRSRLPDAASTARTQMFGAPDDDDIERVWADRGKGRRPPSDATEPYTPLHRDDSASMLTTQKIDPLVTPLDLPVFGNPTPVDTPFSRAPTPSDTPPAARLDLPPETPELIPEPRTMEASPVDEAVRLQRQMRRRSRIAMAAVALVLLVIGGGIAGRVLVTRQREIPRDAIAQRESILLLLRRDDGQSRERAISELEDLLSSYPSYAAAQADLVVALALHLDDTRIQIRRLSAEADSLNRRVARLNEERVPSDWQNRVNAMTERLGEIRRSTDPLMERAGGVEARLNDRFRALEAIQAPAPDDQRELARAQAVYFGVKGSEQALALSERYRRLGGNDGWGSVALAELALNARVSPSTMGAARKAMEELTARDSTFLRSYVLSARLAMAQRQNEPAISGLEAVLALNPAHDVARQLLDWARSGEQ